MWKQNILAGIVMTTIFLFGSYPASLSALTTAELETQVQSLLEQISALKAALEILNGGAAISATTSASCVALSRTLSFGSQGDDVRGLQDFLIKAGVLSEGNITGYFGILTETAVRLWQSIQGIVSSGDATSTGYGVVGPKTRAVIATKCQGGSVALPTTQNTQESTQSTQTPTEVVKPNIAITAPREGIVVVGGDSLRVAWQSAHVTLGTSVSLVLLDEKGLRVGTLASGLKISGEYTWYVPPKSASGCSSQESAIDCIARIGQCDSSSGLCTLAPGTYRISATLSSGAAATSPTFQISGSEYTNIFDALLDVTRNSSFAPSTSSPTSGTSPSGIPVAGSCTHEGHSYAPGTTVSAQCGSSNCPSQSGGTGFVTGTCTGGEWCIPFTAYCSLSLSTINVSAYAGNASSEPSSGYTIRCPQEGYRAYLSCPFGGCVTGWNTCRSGVWIRDTEQRVVQPGTQGPCQSGHLWCEVGSEHGFGCVPSTSCVAGVATTTSQ